MVSVLKWGSVGFLPALLWLCMNLKQNPNVHYKWDIYVTIFSVLGRAIVQLPNMSARLHSLLYTA